MIKKLIIVLFLTSPAFGIEKQIIGPFDGGLNNQDNSSTIGENQAQDLLNVDLSLGGKSVKKREGYGLAYALTYTTSATHGIYDFYDNSGNDIALAFHDVYMTSVVNGGSATVLMSTGTLNATYQCIDSQGSAYCANTSRDRLIKTNGVTFSNQTIVTTGTLVAVTPDRLVQAGFASPNQNRIDFSAAADFTSWTTGVSATSAFQFTVTSPGSHITMITYAFNRIMWFKDASFGYVLPGATAADWVVKTISPNIGTLDNTYVYYKDILYFRGQDGHIWSYDGSNLQKLTRNIGGTISASASRSSNLWTQSSQTDFETSSMTPSGYLSTTITPGSIVLSTATRLSAFTDNVSTDFGAANSLVNLDTTTLSGSVYLSTGSYLIAKATNACQNAGVHSNSDPGYQSFVASTTGNFSRLQVYGVITGSPGTQTIYLLSDNSLKPGATIYSDSFNFNTINSTGSYATVDVTSPVKVTSGSRYWLGIPKFGDVSNNFISSINFLVCGGYNGDPLWLGNGNGITTNNTVFTVNATTYNSSGNFVSRAFDVGFTTNTWVWDWGNFYSSGSIPSGSALTYETQTASSTTGSVWDSLVSVSSGSAPTSTVKQFIRYKASFSTTDTSTSPTINYVEQNMSSRLRPSATYYSQVHNSPNLTQWDAFQVNSQGSTHQFSIRASSTNIGMTSSTPAWTSITSGGIPSMSTNTYLQFKDVFNATTISNSPRLDDFTFNWFEGAAADKSYATFFKDDIWWSVVSGTSGVTTNNTILRLDLLNNAWLVYDIASNGFYIRNSALYFGHSTSGNVFRFGDANSDNGSAINSYWKSKDYFFDPFTDDDFTDLSVFFKTVDNSTMSVTYAVAGGTFTTYSVPLQRTNASFGNYNRNLPQGSGGGTFNIKFGNSAADQPWEFFAGQLRRNDKTWQPSK